MCAMSQRDRAAFIHAAGAEGMPIDTARKLLRYGATPRPLRRRRAYALPLSVVAEIVASKVIKAEVAERRRERAARRRPTKA